MDYRPPRQRPPDLLRSRITKAVQLERGVSTLLFLHHPQLEPESALLQTPGSGLRARTASLGIMGFVFLRQEENMDYRTLLRQRPMLRAAWIRTLKEVQLE